jgi:hypothetical protein
MFLELDINRNIKKLCYDICERMYWSAFTNQMNTGKPFDTLFLWWNPDIFVYSRCQAIEQHLLGEKQVKQRERKN